MCAKLFNGIQFGWVNFQARAIPEFFFLKGEPGFFFYVHFSSPQRWSVDANCSILAAVHSFILSNGVFWLAIDISIRFHINGVAHWKLKSKFRPSPWSFYFVGWCDSIKRSLLYNFTVDSWRSLPFTAAILAWGIQWRFLTNFRLNTTHRLLCNTSHFSHFFFRECLDLYQTFNNSFRSDVFIFWSFHFSGIFLLNYVNIFFLRRDLVNLNFCKAQIF